MVSDGAGILGKCVKLAFTSSPRSSTPRYDLFCPSFYPPVFLSDRALVSSSVPTDRKSGHRVKVKDWLELRAPHLQPSFQQLFMDQSHLNISFLFDWFWSNLIAGCSELWYTLLTLILLILNTVHIHSFVQNGWIINTIVEMNWFILKLYMCYRFVMSSHL